MRFTPPLVSGRFLSREKRFSVHVQLDDGRRVVAHTNNTGRLKGCAAAGHRVWLSRAANPARKLPWTLEIIETAGAQAPGARRRRIKVGVNTALANRLVAEAIADGVITELADYPVIRPEAPAPGGHSRLDFLLASATRRVWVEVKNVTYVENGQALFPDAPTERGRKHLSVLGSLVGTDTRAVLVFCVQRGDARTAGPADAIDPHYGSLLREVAAAGVEILAYGARVTVGGIQIVHSLPVIL